MREGKPIPNGEIKENEEKENAIVKEDNNGIKEEDKEINEGKQKEVKKSKTPSCPVTHLSRSTLEAIRFQESYQERSDETIFSRE